MYKGENEFGGKALEEGQFPSERDTCRELRQLGERAMGIEKNARCYKA